MGTATTPRKSKATAVHAQTKDGQKHFVGIGNLRVILSSDAEGWYAEGLEIDYVAQGGTKEEAMNRFEAGLARTIHLNLRLFGNIKGVLKTAPRDTWDALFDGGNLTKRISLASIHKLIDANRIPKFFENIEYYEPGLAA